MVQRHLLLALVLPAVRIASAQFEIIDTGLPENLFDMSFPTSDTGFAVGGGEDRSLILRTTDGGSSWETYIDEDTYWLYGVSFADAQTGIACGNTGVLYRTVDGGGTWAPLVSGTTQWLMSIDMVDADTAYCAGNGGVIMKTIDGGDTWSPQNSGTGMWLLSIFFTDAMTGYCVGTGPAALRTIDGGATWTAFDPGTTNTLSDIHFVDSARGFCTGFNGTLIRTTDGGDTWQPLTTNTFEDLQSVYFLNASVGYVVGDGHTILRTTDGGDTWSPVPSPSTSDNTEVVVLPDNVVICGDAGLLMHQAIDTQVDQGVITDRFAPFPNPTSGPVTLAMSTRTGMVSVEVLDAAGRICLLHTRSAASGIQLDLGELDRGLYRILVRTGGELRSYPVVRE